MRRNLRHRTRRVQRREGSRTPARASKGAFSSSAALALASLLLTAACGVPDASEPDAEPRGAGRASPEPAATAPETSTDWVTIYDPARAASGYNLVFYRSRTPVLLDMNGRQIHAWPAARLKSRIRLLENGSLLGIGLGRSVAEYDWEGRLVWEYRDPAMLPHHDVVRLANGNTLFVASFKGQPTDALIEVDDRGRMVWRWRSGEHLAPFISETERAAHPGDVTHINSVQELPANRLARRGDRRFRRGNLLVSARNLNEIFVVDRATGSVVWSYGTELDLQHEARMLPRGLPGAGRIQLFDNGYRGTYRYRQSAILEIEPPEERIVWSYLSDDFFSPTGGVQQPLGNGNVLVGSSRGGRAFEVTRDGEIVWQWAPPFQTVRPRRVPYDHTPQLAALGAPEETAVTPPASYRHVDPRAYTFARRAGLRQVVVDGTRRTFLAANGQCQRVFLPAQPSLEVAFGLHRRKLSREGRDDYAARFVVEVAVDGSSERLRVEEVVTPRPPWRRREIAIQHLGLRRAEICIATDQTGGAPAGATEEYAYWENPRVVPGGPGAMAEDDPQTEADRGSDDSSPDADALDLTAEELEARREHLRTLGYVD